MTREKAIELLGEYAINQKNGNLLESRISAVMNMAAENPGEKIVVEVNNNWKVPPKASSWKTVRLAGGTTYRYMVWVGVKA